MLKLLRRFRYHIVVFLAVLGPGFITANVDNDSGGIFTYSAAGAKFGYLPLMTLLVLANITNVMAEFAGIASSLELFHISRYISVPLSAVAVWFLVVKGN